MSHQGAALQNYNNELVKCMAFFAYLLKFKALKSFVRDEKIYSDRFNKMKLNALNFKGR